MTQENAASALARIFAESRTIAVVGLSPKPERPSNQVASYLRQAGYRIVPVNPGHSSILGESCFPDLAAVPVPVDVVNIFRRADLLLPVVQDAVRIQAKVVWMQQGIINQEAAALAGQAGLTVVMDRCMKVEHLQLSGKAGDESMQENYCSLDKYRAKK